MNAKKDSIMGSKPRNQATPFMTSKLDFLRKIGEGCWGEVYEAISRLNGEHVAIKVLRPNEDARQQMAVRKLTLQDLIAKEGCMAGADKIVQRVLQEADDGERYIQMPLYSGSLEDCLRNPEDSEFGRRNASNVLKNVAEALGNLHKVYRVPFCDLKPNNILMNQNGEAHLRDLGSAFMRSIASTPLEDGSEPDLSKMGFRYTRAPENFTNPEKPEFSSDSYAFASLAKFMYTGKYLFQEELDASKTGTLTEVFAGKSKRQIRKMIKAQLADKRIAGPLRKFLARCADPDSSKRPYDGGALGTELEKAYKACDTKGVLGRMLKWGAGIIATGALATGIWSGELNTVINSSSPAGKLHGELYLNGTPNEKQTFLVSERIPDMAAREVSEVPHMVSVDFLDNTPKKLTSDRNAASLTKVYMKECLASSNNNAINSYQAEVYTTLHPATSAVSPEAKNIIDGGLRLWYTVALSFENSLKQNAVKRADGSVQYDLEDVVAGARIPKPILEYAQAISHSTDWAVYRNAKVDSSSFGVTGMAKLLSKYGFEADKDGYMIPRDEVKFIDRLLARVHNDY